MLLVITTPSAAAPAGSTYSCEAWAPVISERDAAVPANCLVMITGAGPATQTRNASGSAAFTFEIAAVKSVAARSNDSSTTTSMPASSAAATVASLPISP